MYAGHYDECAQREAAEYEVSRGLSLEEYEANVASAERGAAEAMDEAARDLDRELAEANEAYEAWLLELPREEPCGAWCEADELVTPF